jgi:hypothetical protein
MRPHGVLSTLSGIKIRRQANMVEKIDKPGRIAVTTNGAFTHELRAFHKRIKFDRTNFARRAGGRFHYFRIRA